MAEFFIYFGERGGLEALSAGGVQLELVWASEGAVTDSLMFQELLRKSLIDYAKCQSGGAFDELNIFNRRG